ERADDRATGQPRVEVERVARHVWVPRCPRVPRLCQPYEHALGSDRCQLSFMVPYGQPPPTSVAYGVARASSAKRGHCCDPCARQAAAAPPCASASLESARCGGWI